MGESSKEKSIKKKLRGILGIVCLAAVTFVVVLNIYESKCKAEDANLSKEVDSNKEIDSNIEEVTEIKKPTIKERKCIDRNGSYTIEEYDTEGVIQKATRYTADGEVERTQIYEYNEQGELLKDVTYDVSGKPMFGNEYEYDLDGNKIAWYNYPKGEKEVLDLYEYDSRNRLIKKSFYTGGKDLFEYSLYTYDDNDNLLAKKDYSPKGNLGRTYEYEYDEEGNLCKMTDSMYGPFSNRHVYEYDKEGRVLFERYYNKDDELSFWVEYLYGPYGETDWIMHSKQTEDNHTRKEYDEKGNIIACGQVDAKGKMHVSTTFEYDNNGNLLKRVSKGGRDYFHGSYEATYNEYGYPTMIHDVCDDPTRNAGPYDILTYYEYKYWE